MLLSYILEFYILGCRVVSTISILFLFVIYIHFILILGRAGSSMYWWEVKVSRGERKHLYLTFDNPGIKLFFEESAIKDMNTALQYFNKDSLKEEDSLGKYVFIFFGQASMGIQNYLQKNRRIFSVRKKNSTQHRFFLWNAINTFYNLHYDYWDLMTKFWSGSLWWNISLK